MRQEGGIGSKIVWKDPAEYVENFFGFRRYFILENRITKALFQLAENPPKEWQKLKIKVRRRDREQTVSGALQSALFGCAFQIQAANMRAAANHEIQSSGAQITKFCQRKLWDIQPHGVHDWLVQPMNIHDEILSPTHPDVAERATKVIYEAVEGFREKVPLIEFEFKEMSNWAEK
jgi:DNA polymerase I-like protein with 3'-5' exonuclease and polymerase domains